MKKIAILLTYSTIAIHSGAQKKSEWKNLNQTEHIVRTLAADEMGGRLVFTEGIDKAAVFIANEFRKAGLQPWNGKSFFQTFSVNQLQFVSVNAALNGKPIDEKNVFAYTERELLQANDQTNDYEPAYISKTDTFFVSLGRLRRKQKKNLLVFVDTTHKFVFNIYTSLSRKTYSGLPELNSYYYSDKDAIIILTDKKPENWSVEYRQRVEKKELKNVVGVLPGKKFSNDRVVFSAHYDHLGIRKPNNEGDSIYNGANDDASGVSAIIQLA